MNKNNININLVIISKNKIGQRIDNFLFLYFKKIPKSLIYKNIRIGKIRINKKKVKPKYKLQNNDEIYVTPTLKLNKKKTSISTKLNKISFLKNILLYEDNYLIIINKPSGIAVHGGSGLSFGIIEGLRSLRPSVRFLELVHRLDKDTSGVLIIAKKYTTLLNLHKQFREKKIKKDYLALVHGKWPSHIKIINKPLIKSILKNGKRIVKIDNNGKTSETHFKIKEQFIIATLIQARPITGRTHQIRVHTQYVGHPILLDDRYGNSFFDKKINKCNLNRIFLHASTLSFQHPISGKILIIKAPLDPILQKYLLYLKINNKL